MIKIIKDGGFMWSKWRWFYSVSLCGTKYEIVHLYLINLDK
jgi:hypothetical protein